MTKTLEKSMSFGVPRFLASARNDMDRELKRNWLVVNYTTINGTISNMAYVRWILKNPATATCMLVCAIIIALWIRSYFCFDDIRYRKHVVTIGDFAHVHEWHVISENGGLQFNYSPTPRMIATNLLWVELRLHVASCAAVSNEYPYLRSVPEEKFKTLGFQLRIFDRLEMDNVAHLVDLVVPWPALGLPFVVLPSIFALRHLRRRNLAREGCCPDCGYDLRESPERCPECGREVKPVIASAPQVDGVASDAAK